MFVRSLSSEVVICLTNIDRWCWPLNHDIICISLITMYFRRYSILFVICVLFTLHIQQDTEAKPFLELFFDDSKFQNSYHKPNYYHRNEYGARPKPVEPVGGKERFKQICNVIRGISDCYAWRHRTNRLTCSVQKLLNFQISRFKKKHTTK